MHVNCYEQQVAWPPSRTALAAQLASASVSPQSAWHSASSAAVANGGRLLSVPATEGACIGAARTGAGKRWRASQLPRTTKTPIPHHAVTAAAPQALLATSQAAGQPFHARSTWRRKTRSGGRTSHRRYHCLQAGRGGQRAMNSAWQMCRTTAGWRN